MSNISSTPSRKAIVNALLQSPVSRDASLHTGRDFAVKAPSQERMDEFSEMSPVSLSICSTDYHLQVRVGSCSREAPFYNTRTRPILPFHTFPLSSQSNDQKEFIDGLDFAIQGIDSETAERW
jgi:hypothetical protein